MLDAYRPIQVFLVLWPTADFELPEDSAAFGKQLCEQFGVFRQVQTVNVQGAAAPPELPRLILLGQRRQWALELAPARVNLRRSAAANAQLDTLIDELRATLLPLHAWLAEQANLRVFRIGLVVDLRCETRSSASEKIMHYFLQPRAVQGVTPNEVHLALHNRLVLGDGLMINRWLRVQPLRTRDPRRLDFAAQVQVDLNTMTEDTRVKTNRDVGEFLDAARKHLDDGIPLLSDPDFLA
jgi:hypothetical protein